MNCSDRCINCILPKSAEFVKFDENGCCSICNHSTENDLSSDEKKVLENKLKAKIEQFKKEGREKSYDCLVGVSGGRDSAYLLYLLVTKHKLRCLGAYYKTPFTPKTVDDNVKMLVKKLNVPLIEIKIPLEKHRKFAKEMIKLWLKKPKPIIANLACAPCKELNHEILKIAHKYGIKHIIYGGNKFEVFQGGAAQFRNDSAKLKNTPNSLWRQTKKMFLIAQRGAKLLFETPQLIKYFVVSFKSSILYITPDTPYLRLRYPNIDTMQYYHYTQYDENAVIGFLNDIGWKIPQNCNSTWRADCSFNELKNFMFKKTSNMTYIDSYLSNMVRSGLISREEALKRAEKEGAISFDRLKEVCNILDIPIKEFFPKVPDKHKNHQRLL